MSTISILLTDVAPEVFGDEVCATNFHWRSHRLADSQLHRRLRFKMRVQRKQVKAYLILHRSVGALRYATLLFFFSSIAYAEAVKKTERARA